MQVSLAALLAASVAAAGTKCGVHQECGHCLDATDDNNDSCFWCYSTRSCQAVTLSIPALHEGKTFNGCVDYGLNRATCACRPFVYTSCADCATAEHPSCVWMPNGTMTTTIQLASGGAVHSKSKSWAVGGRCMVGTGFGPTGVALGANMSFVNDFGTLSAAYRVTPSEWYWAQCTVPSIWMAVALIAAGYRLPLPPPLAPQAGAQRWGPRGDSRLPAGRLAGVGAVGEGHGEGLGGGGEGCGEGGGVSGGGVCGGDEGGKGGGSGGPRWRFRRIDDHGVRLPSEIR